MLGRSVKIKIFMAFHSAYVSLGSARELRYLHIS